MSHAREVAACLRAEFQDPRALCEALGLLDGSVRQAARGITILCPSHGERNPSCSVTRGPDGTVRFRCFGCGFSGDAFTLIAATHDLDTRSDFLLVLQRAAEIAGRNDLLSELRGERSGSPLRVPAKRDLPPPPPVRSYPERNELERIWGAATSVAEDHDASAELKRRGLDPEHIARIGIAKVIPPDHSLPRWARYQGRTWNATGHRMIVRAFDADGLFRSVRAWRVVPGETPKRLPPSGRKAAELVLANAAAVEMLHGGYPPALVIVCEGEPDALVRMAINPNLPVLGVISGSWHDGFAQRVPAGSEVVIRTHRDQAGDKYADTIVESLKNKALVSRLQREAET